MMSFSLGDGRLIEDSAITTLFLPFVTPNASRLTPLYYEYPGNTMYWYRSAYLVPGANLQQQSVFRVAPMLSTVMGTPAAIDETVCFRVVSSDEVMFSGFRSSSLLILLL